ncbi:DgyrCDS12121 [Dimorphilus gyrociliatus]|uniref:DgyrCDS12121 n=1 Tax=Dimorphilus gyrociliatus TaxID=2664684 RepID=A0A7I8W8H2_9ANNE|nr:DgyrCDS12121 [Dimorphilus gyrociliatus]
MISYCLEKHVHHPNFTVKLIKETGNQINLRIRRERKILQIAAPYLTCDPDSAKLQEVVTPINKSHQLLVKHSPHPIYEMDVLNSVAETSTTSPSKRYDVFLMTGDKIIRTTPSKDVEKSPPPPKPKRETNGKKSRIPRRAPLAEAEEMPAVLPEDSSDILLETNRSTASLKDSGLEMDCSTDAISHSSSRIPLSNSSVRSSKSHENYLQGITTAVVDIDLDGMATSVDVLHNERIKSLENCSSPTKVPEYSTSLQNSPDHPISPTINSRKVHMPTFIAGEEPRAVAKSKTKDPKEFPQAVQEAIVEEDVHAMFDKLRREIDLQLSDTESYSKPQKIEVDQFKITSSEPHSNPPSPAERAESLASSDGSDAESLYHQPIKEVDRPSAARLAKRLYSLDGFKKSDISRHLSKKNEFSQLVGDEFLKYFSFEGYSLDKALREFLSHIVLTGETCERERVLVHFAQRFVLLNPGCFNSDDSCHTLTCAILLLNGDLNNTAIEPERKMTCKQFIENLQCLNDGENFPKEILMQIYQSIKNEPLVCQVEQDDLPQLNDNRSIPEPPQESQGNLEGQKKGYMMRKCCWYSNGKKTPLGKRKWKMFYVMLEGMALCLHKNENGFKKQGVTDNPDNLIRIYHAFAEPALDYKKKQHVFTLYTADGSKYMFQCSNTKDTEEWILSINRTSAFLSAPPLPAPCSSQKKFQRYVMPSSYTKLSAQQQFLSHQEHLKKLKQDLIEHSRTAPEKGAKSRLIEEHKSIESYLQMEEKRFDTYFCLLQEHLNTNIAGSLAETVIGEVDEPPSSPTDKFRQTNMFERSLYNKGSPETGRLLRRYPGGCPEDHGTAV